MKKLQNNLIAIDRQLIENNRPKHKLLSLISDVTDVEVSLIMIYIIPTSVILTLINIAIISRNSYIDIVLNIVSNITNINYIDANLTITKILGSVVTLA